MAMIYDEWEDYNPEQQRFSLNMLANVVGQSRAPTETLEDKFEYAINKLLPSLAGEWQLRWGPKVIKKNYDKAKTAPTNAWFVATSASQKMAVLAIAGTAATSVNGWMQDFDTESVIDWNKWVNTWHDNATPVPEPTVPRDPSVPLIARGTAHGVANVLTYKSTKASPNTCVHQYLQTLPADYTIYVTGHSMGGALSPVVALGLLQGKLVTNHEMIALPSAGASPGNNSFSEHWASKFPSSGSGLQAINANFFNTKDMVPMAWSINASQDRERNIENVRRTIYKGQPPNPAGGVLLGVEAGVKRQVKKSKTTYLGIPGAPFTSDSDIEMPLETIGDLLMSFRDQHVDQYVKEAGVGAFVKRFKNIFQDDDEITDAMDLSGDEMSELEAFAEQALAAGETAVDEGS